MKKIIFFVMLVTLLPSCSKKDDKISTDCYLVGFDPCSYINHHIGYILISDNLKDTLITYNFPDLIFSIPSDYYSNYENTGYFPSEARYEFRTRFEYKVATKNELVFLFCPGYLNESEFNNSVQVITLSASKYTN